MQHQSIDLLLGGLLLHLAHIKLELLALKDVAVAAPALAGTGRDGGVQAASGELLVEVGVDLVALAAGGELSLHTLGLLGDLHLSITALLDAELLTVVLHVPLLEGGGIDSDDGALHEGLGADHLVVGGVVYHIQETGLAGHGLGAPREVTVVQAEGTELGVAAANADLGDLHVKVTGGELGVAGLAAKLVLALLAPSLLLAARRTALVHRVTRDTHGG